MPDAQDPQNQLLMPEPAFHMPDVKDPQNKLPMSEQDPHTSTKRHCVS